MTNEERARELAESLCDTVTTIAFGDSFELDTERAAERISAAFDGLARETLERAARVCDANAAEAERDRVSSGDVAIRACALWSRQSFEQNAKDIRALAGQPPEPTPDVVRARLITALQEVISIVTPISHSNKRAVWSDIHPVMERARAALRMAEDGR